ncbi:MAG: TolC family protein [Myxococcota bacterium]
MSATKSPPKSLRERQLALRNEAIIAAAREMLARHGYEALNMQDLATGLGISKATLYQHFASKDALVAEVVAGSMREVEANLDAGGAALSPLERIEHMLRRGLAAKLTHVEAHGAPLPTTVRSEAAFARQHKRTSEHTAALIDSAKAAGEVASELDTDVIVLMVRGLFETNYAELQRKKRYTPEALAEQVIAVFLAGIRTRRAAEPRVAVAPVAAPPEAAEVARPRRSGGTRTAILTLVAGGLVLTGAASPRAAEPEDAPAAELHAAAPGVVSLDALLAAARTSAVDARRGRAAVAVAKAQRDLAGAERWPTLGVSLAYTHNHRASVVRIPDGSGGFDEATLVAANQVDFDVSVSVPILDLAQWGRIDAADTGIRAEEAGARARVSDVERAVVKAYAELVGNVALVEAGRVAEAAALAARDVTKARLDAGFGDDAALPRADAEVANARAAIAAASQGEADARRRLGTLTGLVVDGPVGALEDDLAAEPALATWLADLDGLPAVRAAQLRVDAARQRADAESLGYVPRLDARVAERVTNANGFGKNDSFSAGFTASWALDRRIGARVDAEGAAAEAARVELDAAREDARAAVVDAWHAVESARARADAALVAARAQAKARDVIRARFAAGKGTQLELTTAERDAFQADVARVQALSDLAWARAELRIRAGRGVGGGGS